MDEAANQERDLPQKMWQRFLKEYTRDHTDNPPDNRDVMALISARHCDAPLKEIAGRYILGNKPCYAELSILAQTVPTLKTQAMSILIRKHSLRLFLGMPWGLGIPPDFYAILGMLDSHGKDIVSALFRHNRQKEKAMSLAIWLIPSQAPTAAKFLLENPETPVDYLRVICLHAEKTGYKNAVSAAERILLYFEEILTKWTKMLSRRTGQTQDCMDAIICGYMKFVSARCHEDVAMTELSQRYLSAAEKAADKIIWLRDPNLYSLFRIMEYVPSRRMRAWEKIVKRFGEPEVRMVFYRFRRWDIAMGQRVLRPNITKECGIFSRLAAEVILAKYCNGSKDYKNIRAFVPELEEKIDALETKPAVAGSANPQKTEKLSPA